MCLVSLNRTTLRIEIVWRTTVLQCHTATAGASSEMLEDPLVRGRHAGHSRKGTTEMEATGLTAGTALSPQVLEDLKVLNRVTRRTNQVQRVSTL